MANDTTITESLASGNEQDLLESVGELVPFSDYPQFDWPDFRNAGSVVPYSATSDREDGRFYPVFRNEIDLAMIRGMARRIRAMSTVFPSALNTLQVYTLGTGPTVSIVNKESKYTKSDDNARLLSRVVESVVEQLDLTSLLEELHERSHEEGEALTVLHKTDADGVQTEIVEMDYLREPSVSADMVDWIRDEYGIDTESFVPSWSFGVLTRKRFTNIPLGYHVAYSGDDGADFEFYPASRVVHVKQNVPAAVKRGVSTFYEAFEDLRNEYKLGVNMGKVAAIQAAIAWIEEFQAGTTATQAAGVGPTDLSKPVPTNINQGGGTRNVKATHYAPGSIIRTAQGRKFLPGPLGSERNGNFEIAAQYLLRRIGIRKNIPEYMISGDASNANYSSTMVAESPFVKARERDQEFFVRIAKQLIWKSVHLIWEAATGRSLDYLAQLRKAWDVKVTLPHVQTRNQLELVQRLAIEKANGWVSDQTAMTELGRDPDEERSLGAKPDPVGQKNPGVPKPDNSIAASLHADGGITESFEGHAGRPGHRGGSVAKGAGTKEDHAALALMNFDYFGGDQQYRDALVAAGYPTHPGKVIEAIPDVRKRIEARKSNEYKKSVDDWNIESSRFQSALMDGAVGAELTNKKTGRVGTITGWAFDANGKDIPLIDGEKVNHVQLQNWKIGRHEKTTESHSPTASAALRGALESVESTEEAKRIIESMLESFEGHAGRPGHRGGSSKKNSGSFVGEYNFDRLVREQSVSANQILKRQGRPEVEFELKTVPLDSVKPSQDGEDYDNSSSRALAEYIAKYGESGRLLDYAPIAVDENNVIIDGNHRHAARTFAGLKMIDVLHPKKTT